MFLFPMLWVFFPLQNFAQKEANWWHFGDRAVLHFDSSKTTGPRAKPPSPLITFVGSASISDSIGNLLFYTNGTTVWDRNNRIMTNGTGLSGNTNTSQTTAIVPMPGNVDQYYLFTIDIAQRNKPLHYSIVDMRLRGGFGDVLASAKDIRMLTPPTTDHLTFTRRTGGGYWVVIRPKNSNEFWAYSVTNSGVSSLPVISRLGVANQQWLHWRGHLKFSPTGKKAGMTEHGSQLKGRVTLMDFNDSTGVFSNLKVDTTAGSCYGLEFSPNSEYLYVSGFKKWQSGTATFLYQYESSAATVAGFIKSRIDQKVSGIPGLGALQTGPDYKIYGVRFGTDTMTVIHSPNRKGFLCQFSEIGPVIHQSAKTDLGLPSFPAFLFESCSMPDFWYTRKAVLCQGDSIELHLKNSQQTSIQFKNQPFPGRTIKESGTYYLSLTNKCGTLNDSIRVNFLERPVPDLGADTLLCKGDSLVINLPPDTAIHWAWFDSSSVTQRIISKAGHYWVEGANSCGKGADTLSVEIDSLPEIELSNDTSLCDGQELTVIPITQSDLITWNDQHQGPHHRVHSAGWIIGQVSNSCGSAADSLYVDFRNLPIPPENLSSEVCIGKESYLNFSRDYEEVIWNNRLVNGEIKIEDGGSYNLQLSQNNCWSTFDYVVHEIDCTPAIELPNVFTPNHDGINDYFKAISMNGVTNCSIHIVNRWGNTVFRSNEPSFKWDGAALDGDQIVDGVYFWILEYQDEMGESYSRNGYVTILSKK